MVLSHRFDVRGLILFIALFFVLFMGFLLIEAFDYSAWEGINRALGGSDTIPYQELQQGFLSESYKLSFLNERENAHMQDVRELLMHGSLVFLVSFILLITLFHKRLNLSINNRKTILIGVIAFFFLFLGFPIIFGLFHTVLFSDGSWIFPSYSVLIRAFPFTFFLIMGLRAFILAFVLSWAIGKKISNNQ
jgi:integral membrane protein (TIGR01906 family)